MFRVRRDVTATTLSSAMQGTPTNHVSVNPNRRPRRRLIVYLLALMWRSIIRSLCKLLVGTIVKHVILDRVNAPFDRRWKNLKVKHWCHYLDPHARERRAVARESGRSRKCNLWLITLDPHTNRVRSSRNLAQRPRRTCGSWLTISHAPELECNHQ